MNHVTGGADNARLRPLGFRLRSSSYGGQVDEAAFAAMVACLAVAGGASEGWWGKKKCQN